MNENIKEIIEKISYFDETFPREELQVLIDNQAETTSLLLDAIRNPDEVLDELIEDVDYFLPLYALLILAQFREERAYPLIYNLFVSDAEKVDDAFDEFMTENLTSVLASVSGGDTTYINKLIEDENVNEYVRSAAIDSWLSLFRAKLKTRDEVIEYYKTLFDLPCEEYSFIRGALILACLDIKAVELMPEIEKSCAENKVDLGLIDLNYIRDSMKREKSSFLDGTSQHEDLVDDMIGDIEGWYCFRKPEEKSFSAFETPKLPEFDFNRNLTWDSRAEGTFVNQQRKVGKNEPCPCGSGRKYKKCCLN